MEGNFLHGAYEEAPHTPDCVDDDGMLWTRVEASPLASEKVAYESRVDALLAKLSETRAMSEAESGENVDEDCVDEGGTLWIFEVGAGFPQQCEDVYSARVDGLVDLSGEVNMLNYMPGL